MFGPKKKANSSQLIIALAAYVLAVIFAVIELRSNKKALEKARENYHVNR